MIVELGTVADSQPLLSHKHIFKTVVDTMIQPACLLLFLPTSLCAAQYIDLPKNFFLYLALYAYSSFLQSLCTAAELNWLPISSKHPEYTGQGCVTKVTAT